RDQSFKSISVTHTAGNRSQTGEQSHLSLFSGPGIASNGAFLEGAARIRRWGKRLDCCLNIFFQKPYGQQVCSCRLDLPHGRSVEGRIGIETSWADCPVCNTLNDVRWRRFKSVFDFEADNLPLARLFLPELNPKLIRIGSLLESPGRYIDS